MYLTTKTVVFLVMLASSPDPNDVGGIAFIGSYATQSECANAAAKRFKLDLTGAYTGYACLSGAQVIR